MASCTARVSVAARASGPARSVSLRAPRATALLARSNQVAARRASVVVRAEEAAAVEKEEPKVRQCVDNPFWSAGLVWSGCSCQLGSDFQSVLSEAAGAHQSVTGVRLLPHPRGSAAKSGGDGFGAWGGVKGGVFGARTGLPVPR